MANNTQEVFDKTAADYDRERFRLIPGFHNFYGWAVNLLPPNAREVLDLGAGTGLLSALIQARLPQANLHLIDFSEAMLAQARTRLSGNPKVTFQVAEYCTEPFPVRLDAVVSALSIHHLDDESKRALFRRIHQNLRVGGVFINAEQVLGPTAELEARYRANWLEQVRASGASDKQISDSLLRQQEDRCASVEDQLAWMRAAGFRDADCWYKESRFAVLAGTKQ